MNKLKSHFSFSKQERSGIFFLLLIIVTLQVVFYVMNYAFSPMEGKVVIDKETQAKFDALKQKSQEKDSIRIFPFNPNFISDYKGYTLGMSLEEINRLHAFRAQHEFVNNADEFQKVTLVSDSLLQVISPYFKFPEWTNNKSTNHKRTSTLRNQKDLITENDKFQVYDLNNATAEDLKTVNGIGDKLSARIVKFRDRLGGFLLDDQLNDVYGLEPEVVVRTLEKFQVLSRPSIKKININSATVDEIAKLIYIRYNVATNIVEYREINGSISSFNELTKIVDFPVDKIHRIELYLSL